jgi:hypothetical protein
MPRKIKRDLRFNSFIAPITKARLEKAKDDPQELNKTNVDLYSLHAANAKMKRQFKKGVFR